MRQMPQGTISARTGPESLQVLPLRPLSAACGYVALLALSRRSLLAQRQDRLRACRPRLSTGERTSAPRPRWGCVLHVRRVPDIKVPGTHAAHCANTQPAVVPALPVLPTGQIHAANGIKQLPDMPCRAKPRGTAGTWVAGVHALPARAVDLARRRALHSVCPGPVRLQAARTSHSHCPS